MEHWQAISSGRWRRDDGAEIWKSTDHYYSNPLNPRCLLWEGVGPGNGEILMRAMRTDRRERFRQRRRFGSPEAAARAVDLAYPRQSAAAPVPVSG